jgi:Tfp pilus assembly protein PilF
VHAKDHPDADSLLGFAHLAMGETSAALAAFEDDIRRQGRGQAQLGNLAYAYFRAGQPARAQPYLEELEGQADTGFVSPLALAAIYFAAGDEARGYEMLDAAVEVRVRGVIFLNVSGAFSEQRSDPRFVAILKRVGLPVDDT